LHCQSGPRSDCGSRLRDFAEAGGKLAGFQFLGRKRQAAADPGLSIAAGQFERAPQRPYPLAHTRQTATHHDILRHADAVVRNLPPEYLAPSAAVAFQNAFDVAWAMTQDVGYSLLHHAIYRHAKLRHRSRQGPGRFQMSRRSPELATGRREAVSGCWLCNPNSSICIGRKAVQDAAIGQLQGLDGLQCLLRRRVRIVLAGRAVIDHGDDVGPIANSNGPSSS